MQNFIYNSKTKIIFGKDQLNQLESLLQEKNITSLLLVYGRTAIKQLGIYDQVLATCEKLNIKVVEEANVRPNPDITSVRSGIEKAKQNNVDFILAAGGGSVVDCAKAIGFGTFLNHDVWDVYVNKGKASKSLPIGAIITLAATGTETNGNSVISNDETDEKRSVAYPFSVPEFAIIDPTYTLSVNTHHTFAGSIDIIMHVMEQYFSNTDNTDTSDYMSLGVIKSVIENTNQIILGNDSYQVRANLSWASTIGLNWILGVDKVGDWATHRLSYVLTKQFGITHGYALAMLFTSWGRIALKYNPDTMERRLRRFGEFLFNESNPQSVLDSLDSLFTSWNADVKISQSMTLSNSQIEKLVSDALALGNVGTVIKVDEKIAKEIFELSCEVK